MADEGLGPIGPGEIAYRLELTPAQLKVTFAALHSLLDDFGHDQPEVHRVIHEILDKLPDEHAIRSIDIGAGVGSPASERNPSRRIDR